MKSSIPFTPHNIDQNTVRQLMVVLASHTGWSLQEIGNLPLDELIEWVNATQTDDDNRP